MNRNKVVAVQDWQIPQSTFNVGWFIGFANFYRRSMRNFFRIIYRLTVLTRRSIKFKWREDCEQAFETLREAFVTALILTHFHWTKAVVVETDASDWVSAGMLSQQRDNGVLHSVVFYSKKHSSAETNSENYDKELMRIVRAFEVWRAEQESVESPIQVLSDHKNLQYFMSNKNLGKRQSQLAEYLSHFGFQIMYQLGKKSTKSNILTRWSGDLSIDGDEQYKNILTVIKLLNIMCLLADTTHVQGRKFFEILWEKGIVAHSPSNQVLQLLRDKVQHYQRISLPDFFECEERLLYRDRHVVPDYLDFWLHLMQIHYYSSGAGYR